MFDISDNADKIETATSLRNQIYIYIKSIFDNLIGSRELNHFDKLF